MNHNQYLPSLSIFGAIRFTFILILIYIISICITSFISNPSLSALIAGIFEIILVIIFIIVMIKKEEMDKNQFQFKKISITILGIGFVMMVSYGLLPIPDVNLYDGLTKTNNNQPNFANINIYAFLRACITTPILEELFSRGIILGGLLRRYSPIVAIITASILFGVLHVSSFIFPTMMGIFLGWIYYKTQNLLYCILLHSAINSIFFLGHLLIKIGYTESYEAFYPIWAEVCFGILLFICIIILHFKFKKESNKE